MPLLLTGGDALAEATREQLVALDIERVVLVGGTAAIGEGVVTELAALGIEVARRGGATRGATAVELARFGLDTFGLPLRQVVLTRPDDFPDALAAGPIAGAEGAPILLAGAEADAWLAENGCGLRTLRVAGGTSAVSDAAADAAAAAAQRAPCVPRITPDGVSIPVGADHTVAVEHLLGAAYSVEADPWSRGLARPEVVSLGAEFERRSQATVTSLTPGLVTIRACGLDAVDLEHCLTAGVRFSARYTAAVGEGGTWLQVLDGEACLATTVPEATVVALMAGGSTLASVPGVRGCAPLTGVDRDALDAAPGDYLLAVDGVGAPLTVVGDDFAEWGPLPPAPPTVGPLKASGVELLANIPETSDVTALNFLDVGGMHVLLATGRFGLRSYDVTDPSAPALLDELAMPDFWENEDMDVDATRGLVFPGPRPASVRRVHRRRRGGPLHRRRVRAGRPAARRLPRVALRPHRDVRALGAGGRLGRAVPLAVVGRPGHRDTPAGGLGRAADVRDRHP